MAEIKTEAAPEFTNRYGGASTESEVSSSAFAWGVVVGAVVMLIAALVTAYQTELLAAGHNLAEWISTQIGYFIGGVNLPQSTPDFNGPMGNEWAGNYVCPDPRTTS